MKLLIVEDEGTLANALKTKFEMEGYSVTVVTEGGSAYETIKKVDPDMILLDIILPRKNGFVVLSEIKADINLKDIPVIMLSNLDTDEDIKRSLSMGAVDYFVKANHPIKEIVEKVKGYSMRGR